MQKAARQEVTVGGLEAGYGQRTCFVWPIQRSENILISCQSHEISHKNVDFWLLLKNRKSDKLALTPTWQSVTAAGCGRPSVDKAGILRSSVSTASSFTHLQYPPCPTPVHGEAYSFRNPGKCYEANLQPLEA